MSKMIVLGIDPGYAIVGYGVIEVVGSNIIPIVCGVIETPTSESIPVRLAMLDEKLSVLIKKYLPDAIAVEELFFNTNTTTAIKVAQARGVILLNAIKQCGELYEYTPLQVKMALTGNGRADKHQMQYMVKALLGLDEAPKPDDAADALAVAICHAQTTDFSKRVLN